MSDCNKEIEPSTSQMERRRIDNDEQQPKVMDEEGQNQLAIAAVPNEENERESRSKIFKLDVDSVQEMLDYLSIKDIHSVSETCTRMQRITVDYLKTYLPSFQMHYDDKLLNGFKEFVQKLVIHRNVNDEGYRYIGLHCKSLKQINFFGTRLTPRRIGYLKPILHQIESVVLYSVIGDFHEKFLQFCPNLKHLIINFNRIIWLLRSYPKLEHLELSTLVIREIPELRSFFERNPGLKTFTIGDELFLENINVMLQTKIKLQVLALRCDNNEEAIYHYLNLLYDQGFYRRLHLQTSVSDQEVIDKIVPLKGLEMLSLLINHDSSMFKLNSLTNLKELCLHNVNSEECPINLQSTAKSLVNLNRIYFGYAEAEFIEPFIQYSATLKVIKIDHFGGKYLDLLSLNKKREQLDGAGKVIIYLNEKGYLETKWGNKTTDFKMIEVKRAESYDRHISLSLFPFY